MRSLTITKCGELRYNETSMVVCPILSCACPDGGINYISCNTDCAWYTVKGVTDHGLQGAFCGDKFIGNLKGCEK